MWYHPDVGSEFRRSGRRCSTMGPVTATPIFDELVASYLSEDLCLLADAFAKAHERHSPCVPDAVPAVGLLAQWWSHCERTAG